MNGHTGTAQLLISSGANIDITDEVSSDIKLLHFVNILMTIIVKGSSYMSTSKAPHMSKHSTDSQCCTTDF